MIFVRRILRLLLPTLMAATVVAGCAAPSVSAQSVIGSTPPLYKLGTGDKVRITVFGEQSLNGEYPVGPDGTIALPLIGNVPARGLSASELQTSIVTKLSPAYILDPRVSIDVVNFRPFYILGEVSRPGFYPYADSLSVAQAVAIAGGYSYRANTKKVFVRHAGESVEQEYSLKGGKQIWVIPGDTIRVAERFF